MAREIIIRFCKGVILFDRFELEPIHFEGVRDYHVHCDYSIDAVGTVDEYCEAALKRNLAEICFTTHYDCNPIGDCQGNLISINGVHKVASIANLQLYVDDVRRVAEKFYAKGLSVKLGLEFGWFDNCLEIAQKVKDAFDFDYFLCGIHEIENICFCCHTTYEKCFERFSADEMVKKYFVAVITASDSKLFDTIAHLEYYMKYGQKYYDADLTKAYEPYLDSLFQSLKKSNTTLEINTAGIRHGVKQYYPNIRIINRAKKEGVEIQYLGSDAHRPQDIGFEFEIAAAFVPDTITGTEE